MLVYAQFHKTQFGNVKLDANSHCYALLSDQYTG